MRTSYYGIPGTNKFTKVHVINKHHEPICGNVISEKMEEQWCAQTIVIDYVECETCKKKAKKILKLALEKQISSIKKNC